MLQRILNIILTKFFFLKFLIPNYFIKMTTVTENNIAEKSTAESTSNLEVEMEKSSLENKPVEIDSAKAEQFKNEGNEEFKSICYNRRFLVFKLINTFFSTKKIEQNFVKAAELYTKAIEFDPSNHVYYGNRSFAHIKSEFYGDSLLHLRCSMQVN